jgi:hypothetical protein
MAAVAPTLGFLTGAAVVSVLCVASVSSRTFNPPSERRLEALAAQATGKPYDAVILQLQQEARALLKQAPGGFGTPNYQKQVLVYRVGNDMAVEMPKGARFYVALGVDDANVVRRVSWDTMAPATVRAKTVVSVVNLTD